MRSFGSDNHTSVHPQIMQSILDCNHDHAASYGTDDLSLALQQKIKSIFGQNAESHLVFNGTAANVLCLKAGLKSFESCFVSDVSHLHLDECAAPESYSGKLITVPSKNGKINLENLKKNLTRRGDQHYSQTRMVSLSQPTELGTVYEIDEIKEITTWAHEQHMFVHIDGARLANAAAYLKCDLVDLTTSLNVDLISFGGTKNGFLFGELVIILNKTLQKDFKYYRKQLCQLPSKTRYMANQFLTYFDSQLYKKIAHHSHEMAIYFENEIKNKIPEIQITQKVQSNAIFAVIPKSWVKPLREKHFFYVWDESTFECRLMTSWDTTKSDIHSFIETAESLRL